MRWILILYNYQNPRRKDAQEARELVFCRALERRAEREGPPKWLWREVLSFHGLDLGHAKLEG